MTVFSLISAEETPPLDAAVPTGLVWDQRFQDHDTGPGHPESPKRLDAVREALEERELFGNFKLIPPRPVEERWLRLTHSEEYLKLLKQADADQVRVLPTGDTPFSDKMLETAGLATGGMLAACDMVIEGAVKNAFCAVRPPGHHATRDRGMGFCVYNHVAVAAKYLREKHGLERILVVDWDVHHGNGTYDILKADPKVFQFHLHQRGIYPGTGSADERGEGDAEGNTIHVPLPAGSGREAFVRAIKEQLEPAMERFRPQFVLLSAGFDAHARDPLAGLGLESEDYGELTRRLRVLADRYAEGRMVSVLEGGYHLEALGESVAAHVGALMEVREGE